MFTIFARNVRETPKGSVAFDWQFRLDFNLKGMKNERKEIPQ